MRIQGFCVLYGPELLAFVADAPRFRAWVDETGWISRIVFVLANMAQVVFAFLPGEPLELGAGYAFGFWEGTLWCLVASALGTAAVMALVRAFGIRIVGLFFSPDKITSMRWLRDYDMDYRTDRSLVDSWEGHNHVKDRFLPAPVLASADPHTPFMSSPQDEDVEARQQQQQQQQQQQRREEDGSC